MTRLFPAAVLICAAATSCAGLRSHETDDLIAVLDATGVAEPAYVVDSGAALTFVNGDSRPHQISSRPLPRATREPCRCDSRPAIRSSRASPLSEWTAHA